MNVNGVRLCFPAERRGMGKPNNALSVYMNRPDRIRSVLEYYLGERLPGDWECGEIRGQYSVRDHTGRLSLRQRDYLGKAHGWGTNFLLGLENQQNINLIYPWRLMEMDCLTYGREIGEIQEENTSGKIRYEKGDDFLYRYRKDDRLTPVLNLMLYWGEEKWETPLALREMTENISALPKRLQQLAGDYKVGIIRMREIPEKALREMDSDLKYVLGSMKRAGSPKEYEAYIQENREFFSRIPKSAFDVIDACVNIKSIRQQLKFVMNQETKEEEADMCKALAGIERNARRQGRQQGIEQVGTLLQRLVADGRQEDLLKAATDRFHLQRLLKEYCL